MITFEMAVNEAMRLGHISPDIISHLPNAPLYIYRYGKQDMTMPSAEAWQKYSYFEQFQKVLPAPITRTIQTSDSLRGYSIASILVSDGDILGAYKFMLKDQQCILFLQSAHIPSLIARLRVRGQGIDVNNKCFSISPVPNELPIREEPLRNAARILWITTLHFIYTACEEKNDYELA